MPEGGAHYPDGGKFEISHEVGDLARMDCARFPLQESFFAPIREVSYGEFHSQEEPGPVQETSR